MTLYSQASLTYLKIEKQQNKSIHVVTYSVISFIWMCPVKMHWSRQITVLWLSEVWREGGEERMTCKRIDLTIITLSNLECSDGCVILQNPNKK